MLKIEKDEKNIFPFKELASMELFYRENDTDVYYSYFDSNGMFTAVNLTTGEEAEDLLTTEIVTRIQGKLTISGQAVKACLFYLTYWAGRPRRGRPVIPLPHLIWQFLLVKVSPAYAPFLSRNFASQGPVLGPIWAQFELKGQSGCPV